MSKINPVVCNLQAHRKLLVGKAAANDEAALALLGAPGSLCRDYIAFAEQQAKTHKLELRDVIQALSADDVKFLRTNLPKDSIEFSRFAECVPGGKADLPEIDGRTGKFKSAAKKSASTGLTRDLFRSEARPMDVTINGVPMTAAVKEFQTGSLGWYLNGKLPVRIGDATVTVQIGVSLTICGSKEL